MAPAPAPHDPLTVFLLAALVPLRRRLAELLRDEGMEIVGESSSARDAARSIPVLRPRVAVLDLTVPDGDGIALCREVRRTSPGTRCVILASFLDHRAYRAAMDAGASAFVLRQIRDHGLPAAVRRAACTEPPVPVSSGPGCVLGRSAGPAGPR
jgi:DNA-binding NarL/FixJ family response regulator